MRRIIRIAIAAAAWLLASPTLQFTPSAWLEVGVPPAAARVVKHAPQKAGRHGVVRRRARGSSMPVLSNQPGLYPMQTYAPPSATIAAPGAFQAPPVAGYPHGA